mmetsp:Transcript_15199/g.19041  ORF Transcript_15199/g.19041 Transcript_15199/m.19041 type:complete len:222 (+) Transcript_15199:753-1418(+)
MDDLAPTARSFGSTFADAFDSIGDAKGSTSTFGFNVFLDAARTFGFCCCFFGGLFTAVIVSSMFGGESNSLPVNTSRFFFLPTTTCGGLLVLGLAPAAGDPNTPNTFKVSEDSWSFFVRFPPTSRLTGVADRLLCAEFEFVGVADVTRDLPRFAPGFRFTCACGGVGTTGRLTMDCFFSLFLPATPGSSLSMESSSSESSKLDAGDIATPLCSNKFDGFSW